MTGTNHCGTCTACCRVYAIPRLKPPKPAGAWCTHCVIGKGCDIYEMRPPICKEFECLWLQSQKREDPKQRLSPELRPDKCKVVFSPTTNENVMAGVTMPGLNDAWRKGPVRELIDMMIRGGMHVVVGQPQSRFKMLINARGEKSVEMTAPDEDGMQWGKNVDLEWNT